MIKNWLGVFINLTIGAKDQEAGKAASEPAIVSYRDD
jgi:hypothetical protein